MPIEKGGYRLNIVTPRIHPHDLGAVFDPLRHRRRPLEFSQGAILLDAQEDS
jgi:hypothetical protein